MVTLVGLVEDIWLDDALVFAGVTLITDGETVNVGAEQFTLVPGIVGFSASGGVAKVVAGAPETVAEENRLVNGLWSGPKETTRSRPGSSGSPFPSYPG